MYLNTDIKFNDLKSIQYVLLYTCIFKKTFLGVKVSYLQHKVASPEVGNGPREAGPAPHKPEEQGPLVVRELLHHLPEPIHQRRCGVHPFVGRH